MEELTLTLKQANDVPALETQLLSPVGTVVPIKRDTTENWNAQISYIPRKGEVIIYTDHGTITDDYGETVNVPGVKIGDGSAYLIDLPFVGADVRYQILTELREHTSNTVIHVTREEREFWNAKLNYQVSNDELIFNRN